MKTTYYLHNADILVISSGWSLCNHSFTSTLSFQSASISIVPNPLNNLPPSLRQDSQKPAKARAYLCNTYALSKSVLCNKTVSLFERSEIAQLGNSPRTTAQVQYYHHRCCYDSVFAQILWGAMIVDTCISNELSYETSRKCWNVFNTLFKAMSIASGLKRSQSQSYGSDSK